METIAASRLRSPAARYPTTKAVVGRHGGRRLPVGGCESESATHEDFRSSSVASIVQAPFEKPAC